MASYTGIRGGFVQFLTLVIVFCLLGGLCLAQGNATTQHYKMLSTVEFDGQGQFRNQVETAFEVKRQPLEDEKVRFFVSTDDLTVAEGTDVDLEAQAKRGLSFVVDRATKQVAVDGPEYSFFEMVNNECVKSLEKVTKDNIGKSWNQSIELPSLGAPFPSTLKFKLKAIGVTTDLFGDMIAVRAVSGPFRCGVPKADTPDEMGTIQSRIGTVYLFDLDVETIYMSISSFEARTKVSGSWEVLRHEVATYMTDESGDAVDLSGLGKSFESLVKGLKMKGKELEVVEPVDLPEWALAQGLKVSQMATICASAACEGASNPVTTHSFPAANTLQQQSFGLLNSMGGLPLAGGLGAGVPGVGGMDFAVAPLFLGVGAGNAALIGGGIAGGAVLLDDASD